MRAFLGLFFLVFFYDIQNNQSQGWAYLPKFEADKPYWDLDYYTL